MGSGNIGVTPIARTGLNFGETDKTARYTPGVIHWEGDRAYMYYESVDGNEDGHLLYRTGTAGDSLALHPVAADTGAKVIGVAVSDVASGYFGWCQVYGPMTAVKRYTAIAVPINSYLIGVDDSTGCRGMTEGYPTYAAGVFGYSLLTNATTVGFIQAYLTCL
jgi:hypothetical protein